MLQHMLVLLLVALPAVVSGAGSEVFVFGESPTAHEGHQGTLWTYDAAGDDWVGVDGSGKAWSCSSGKQQSPINLLTTPSATRALANEHRAVYELGTLPSNGSNIKLTNNGHSVEVSWTQADFAPKVLISVRDGQPLVSSIDLDSDADVKQVAAMPKQFHFHAHSEHLLAGHLYPLEAHLVSVVDQATLPSCPPGGCVMVTGVLFELSDDLVSGSDWLDPLFKAMPMNEGDSSLLSAGAVLDLQQLLPNNRSYLSYAGSLTTPPCTEGVLWVMMLNTQKMSLQQWRRFMTAVGDYNCTLQQSTQQAGNSSTGSSQGSSAAGNSTISGRRLLHKQSLTSSSQRHHSRALQEQASQYSCKKLGAGSNFRLPQPLNGRVLRLWRDSNAKKGYLPEDAATAASAGAVAGIVVGTTLGAGLTAVIGCVAYKEYQKRRLKRFYKYGVSSGDMLSMQREVETQWLTMRSGTGGTSTSSAARPI